MRLAKNVAAGLKCDSVLFGLDKLAENNIYVQSLFDDLKREFYSYGQPEILRDVCVFQQTKSANFSRLGTMSILKRLPRNEKTF